MGAFLSLCRDRHSKGDAKVDVRAQIVQLKGKRDELETYRESVAARLAELDRTIRTHARAKEREKALMCMRRRELYRSQLSKADDYLFQVLAVISDTEMAQVNLSVYQQLKVGAELLGALSRDLKLEDVERMKDTEQRCRDNMNEVASILGHDSRAVEECELLQELEQLTQQAASPAASSPRERQRSPKYGAEGTADVRHLQPDDIIAEALEGEPVAL